jgi:hypothetical protein
MPSLADQIERAAGILQQLLNEACGEIQRDDLPEGDGWDPDLEDAQDASAGCWVELSEAGDFGEKIEVVLKMLRRIDAHDEEVDRKWAEKNP